MTVNGSKSLSSSELRARAASRRLSGQRSRITLGQSIIVLHRLDHWPTYLPSLLWGALVGAASVSDLLTLEVAAALWSSALVLAYGFAVNALCDVRSDLRSRVKSSSAMAVRRLGTRTVRVVLVAEVVASLIISAVPTLTRGSGDYLPVVCLGALVVSTIYSVPPIRAKARSSMGFVVMALKSGTFPGLYGLAATHSQLEAIPLGVLLVAVSASVASRGLWHAIPDVHVDAAAGIRTFPVVHGAVRAGYVSLILATGSAVAALFASTELFGLPLAFLACVGMFATIWFRLATLSVDEPTNERVTTSVASIPNERLNSRWNSITLLCLCVAAFLHVTIPALP